MDDSICIPSLLGASLMAAVLFPGALAYGESNQEAHQQLQHMDDGEQLDADGSLADRAREVAEAVVPDDDRFEASSLDESTSPKEASAPADELVDTAVDQAHQQALTDGFSREAVSSIDRAYDAALIRTDIELDRNHDVDTSLLDDQQQNFDPDRVQRLRAFFERFGGEDSPAPLVRLREVGSQLAGAGSSHLHLQPHVPNPEWREAMALLEDGDCKDALERATELLGPPEIHADGEPAIAYVFARMKMCNEDGEREQAGRQMMRELTGLSSPISRLARSALDGSADQIDDDAMSIGEFIRTAKRRAGNGDVDEAIEELSEFREQLDRGWNRHRVRFAQAEILEDAGRIDEAVLAYRGIYRKTAGWRSSNGIASRIEDAEDRLGRTIIRFGDRIDRMRALISRGRYRQAREVSRENAQIRGVGGTEIRGWTRYRQALQNERQRNRHRAAEQFEEADRLVEDPVIRPRLYFGWARAERRTDGTEKAIELYDRICEEYSDHHLCPNALFEAARLLQYQNEHDRARQRFAELISFHSFDDNIPSALWRYSLSAYLQDDFEDAIPPLKTIVDHHSDIQDASELTIGLKATYWIGVNYLQLGDEAQARRWLQRTIDEGPLTWYGRLAASRMNEAGMRARIPQPTARLTRDEIEDLATLRVPENPRLSTAAELTRLQLYEEALDEVQSQLNVHPAPEAGTRMRAALHLAVDEPHWAHWIMKSVIDESGPTHSTLRDWGLAFPLNYFELSHEYGDQFGVSPHLVHAIMRQESGFRPRVSSHAGAMGLMQLMPGTARYTERTFFDEQNLTRSQILDEETNVRLGAMYIRIHEAHASDHTPLALAGYNAGPAPLQSWFDRYGDRELDAFVESITYRETRGYVRKVMTSYITYQGLYGDGGLPQIELQLPDELRDWGEVPEVEEDELISMVIN